MVKEKEYPQLQAEAKILGINPNQKKDLLIDGIAAATTPEMVAQAREVAANVAGTLEATVIDLETRLEVALHDCGESTNIDEGLKRAVALMETQLADRNVRTDPYLSGIANGIKLAIAAVQGVDVDEDELIKPMSDSGVKGAKQLTGRQRLLKEARKYITLQGGMFSLRTGLAGGDIKMADEIMEALGVEKGTYNIPNE
jgi:hypothetical protein